LKSHGIEKYGPRITLEAKPTIIETRRTPQFLADEKITNVKKLVDLVKTSIFSNGRLV